MEIIKLPVKAITPYKGNAKKHTDRQIQHIINSIERFGFCDPIGVWGDKNIIVEGHGRYLAQLKRGAVEVDCIRLDHLTDDERRAYTLAHNQATMETAFDADMLKIELVGISGVDMAALDFNLDAIFKEKPLDYKQSKRLDNFFRTDFEYGGNGWGIPETAPYTGDLSGIEWVSFGEKAKIKDFSNIGLHFYIDDYKFESVWTTPDKWIDMFQKCRAVVTPDFSNYTDMPKAQQLWNHYRRQWCARHWQERGVNVVSSLSWGTGQVYDWSFAGIPKGTTVAASFVGGALDRKTALRELQSVMATVEPCKLYIKANAKDAAALRDFVDFELINPYNWGDRRAKE